MLKKISNQHGDVVFEEVANIPEGAKKINVENGWVFEHGEGVHTHVFEDVSGIEVYKKNGMTYVRVKKDPMVNHEEHGYQPMKPGIKVKRLERVWDYENEEARNVLD